MGTWLVAKRPFRHAKHIQTRSLLASAFLAQVSKAIHPPFLSVSYLIIAPPWDPSWAIPGSPVGTGHESDLPPAAAKPSAVVLRIPRRAGTQKAFPGKKK